MPDEPPSELERVRAQSLQRLAAGQLPVEAERRLQALRSRPDFFTSDLSVSEFALGRELDGTAVVKSEDAQTLAAPTPVISLDR